MYGRRAGNTEYFKVYSTLSLGVLTLDIGTNKTGSGLNFLNITLKSLRDGDADIVNYWNQYESARCKYYEIIAQWDVGPSKIRKFIQVTDSINDARTWLDTPLNNVGILNTYRMCWMNDTKWNNVMQRNVSSTITDANFFTPQSWQDVLKSRRGLITYVNPTQASMIKRRYRLYYTPTAINPPVNSGASLQYVSKPNKVIGWVGTRDGDNSFNVINAVQNGINFALYSVNRPADLPAAVDSPKVACQFNVKVCWEFLGKRYS